MSNNVTKTKIMEAAEELLLTNNFEDISIRKICTLAEVSYGSFYHQIKSKENLLVMIRENAVKEGEEIFLKEMENKSSIEKIMFISNLYIDYVIRYGYKVCGYFIVLAAKNPLFAPPPGVLLLLPELINEAIAVKEFDSKYDAGYIYRAILSVLRGSVFEWCANKGESDLKADVLKTFSFLIDNLKNQEK